ncbi:putative immunoglobulin-blocking virulence protein [Mycoplasma leonicaptivi]|uniref:putative immunoglobulin-blocking virulence protein n=1 Tax=Mycoplasma leonicaptivi TaxID=36742 RepID=UPI000683F4F1|nr:putative immunoglobulin-blocking virulence protein [Mycoplasma leonicaptivi]
MIMSKKMRYMLVIYSGATLTAVTTGLLLQKSLPESKESFRFFGDTNNNLENKNNLDFNSAFSGSKDINIKEIIKPEEKIEPIKEQPIVPTPPAKPKEKPAPKPEPIKEPPIVAPQPPKEKPKTETKTIRKAIEVPGYPPIIADIVEVPERQDLRSDIEKGIVNRVKYKAEVAPDFSNVQITSEHEKQLVENAKSGVGFALRNVPKIHLEYFSPTTKHADNIGIISQNPDAWVNLIYKFSRILANGDKIREFLTEEGQREYPKLRAIKGEYEHYIRGTKHIIKVSDLAIIRYIDTSKFTETTEESKNYLRQGYTVDKDDRNAYIDENGKIGTHAWSPIVNKVTSELSRNNYEKRVFGWKEYYNRSGYSIEEGEYPGWNKRNVTDEYSKYNVSSSDGIKVEKLTRQTPDPKLRNDGIVVTFDAANRSGYQKTLKFIKDLEAANEPITGYRIKNIGKTEANQNFDEIFKALPNKLPLLELFFESYNTSALQYLEDKEIDELALYTSGNTHAEEWALNPWATKGVAWINTQDYNSSFDYGRGVVVFTRISFNSLAFNARNWISKQDLHKINNGLRMAYFVRNNERAFQGRFGPGLKPDRDSGGNSYMTGLDLSDIPQIKSLRGLIFYDEEKGKGANLRKLTRLVLHNSSETFEIDSDEMNKAQFAEIIDTSPYQMPKSKIIFSNGKQTKKIKITPTQKDHGLNATGAQNLRTLLNYSDNTFNSSTEIIVPQDASILLQSLKAYGFNARVENDLDSFQEL